MATTDPRMDAYIAKAATFAQPILTHLRAIVHRACPDCEEAVKWGMPFFVYHGTNLCGMAAFKQHAGFHFWRGSEVVGASAEEGMGQFGKLVAIENLPAPRQLTAMVKKAMALIDDGPAKPAPRTAAKPALPIPDDLAGALAQKNHAAARAVFDGFSPSARREYIEWITGAKTDATRQKRLATTLEWLAEGKHRNWKYMT